MSFELNNEVRQRAIESIQNFHNKFQIGVKAEDIENDVFVKANGIKAEYAKELKKYVDEVKEMIIKRTQNLQNVTPVSFNSRPNNGSQNQINGQHINGNQQINNGSHNPIMTAQNGSRTMMNVTGNIQRPVEQQFVANSITMTPQKQQVHNAINTNTVRLVGQGIQTTTIPVHDLDNNNGAHRIPTTKILMNNQQGHIQGQQIHYQMQNQQMQNQQMQNQQIQNQQIQNQQMQNQQIQNQQIQNQQIQNQQMQNQQMQNRQMQNQQMQNQQIQNQQIQNQQMQNQQIQNQPMQNQQMRSQQIHSQQIHVPQVQGNHIVVPHIQVPQIQVTHLMPSQPIQRVNPQIIGQMYGQQIQSQVVQNPVYQISNTQQINQQTPQIIYKNQPIFVQNSAVNQISVAESPVQQQQISRPIIQLVNNSVTKSATPPTPQTTVVQPIVTTAKINPQINTNVGSNTPAPNTSTKPMPKVSQEECVKVDAELLLLKEQYINFLHLILENNAFENDKEKKVFTTISNVINAHESNRNISLKHIEKIKELCIKAENVVRERGLKKPKPSTYKTSEELFGQRVIPDRHAVTAAADITHFDLDFIVSTSNNATSTLDSAFDDILHQVSKTDRKLVKRVQNQLIQDVRTKFKKHLHCLPKWLQKDTEDCLYNDNNKMETNVDENEFDVFDNIEYEGHEERRVVDSNRALDPDGLLRTDIEITLLSASKLDDLQSEINLVQNEFRITQIDEATCAAKWSKIGPDSEGSSSFYAITFHNDSLPTHVPALLIRVSSDYQFSGSVEWNLNLELYQGTASNSDERMFLENVYSSIEYEFASLSRQCHDISGVSFMMALSIYKRSILTGLSNYQCRKMWS